MTISNYQHNMVRYHGVDINVLYYWYTITALYVIGHIKTFFQMMNLLMIYALITVAATAPGLLRIPKVYNAVITSNQNLSPSRAFPVIQPVIHRTAVAYVPPFYYTQIAPHFTGSEVVHYPQISTSRLTDNDQTSALGSHPVEATSFSKEGESSSLTSANRAKETSNDATKEHSRKNGGGEQVPLTFYPNYHSVYYDPYIYTYNGITHTHYAPGTYYIDYQPYNTVEPIPPASRPKDADGHLLPSYHDEKSEKLKDEKENIPNVPPPPLPTSIPKRS